MLHNPNWKKDHSQFSLDSLIKWLEKQPARTEYNYFEPDECVLGLWVKSIDPTYTNEGVYYGSSFVYRNSDYLEVKFDKYAQIVAVEPCTFGAALQRAKQAKDDRAI